MRVGDFFLFTLSKQMCNISGMSNAQYTAAQFVTEFANKYDFATETTMTNGDETVPAIIANGFVYAITDMSNVFAVSDDQVATVEKYDKGNLIGTFFKPVHRSLNCGTPNVFLDSVSHYAVGQEINFDINISENELARRRDLTKRLADATEAVYSEVFWLETRDDVFDTINDGAPEPEQDFDIYFVANWQHIDAIEKFVTDIENGIREENEAEEVSEFETSMDRFERLTGLEAWSTPFGLDYAVDSTVDSYAYAEPSDMNDVTVVDIFA